MLTLAAALLALTGCGADEAEQGDVGRVSRHVPYWYLTCVDFVDARHGWAVGGVGGLLVRTGVAFATTDGGQTWRAQRTPLRLALRGVDFIDRRLGFAVGCGGTILRCTNGRTWHKVDSGTTNSLYAVEFLDRDTGWAVGDGVLLYTTDGGDTWQKSPHRAAGVQFTDIAFADHQHGWAIGCSTRSHGNWGATLLATSNGGQTWFEQPVPTAQALYALHFIDMNEGWIVGNHGVILHTTTGGDIWETQRRAKGDEPGFLRGVYFVDRHRGWAVGGRGRASRVPVILQTRDGGRRWYPVVLSEETFYCWVTALDRKNVWVVGNHFKQVRSAGWNDWAGSTVADAPRQGGPVRSTSPLQRLMSAAHMLF